MLANDYLIHLKAEVLKLMMKSYQHCTTVMNEIKSSGLLEQLYQAMLEISKSLSSFMENLGLVSQQLSTLYSNCSTVTTQRSTQKLWRQTQMHFQQKCLNQIRSSQYSTMETLARLRITRRSIQSSRMRK